MDTIMSIVLGIIVGGMLLSITVDFWAPVLILLVAIIRGDFTKGNKG